MSAGDLNVAELIRAPKIKGLLPLARGLFLIITIMTLERP